MVDRPALRAWLLRDLLLTPQGPLGRVEVVERTASTNTALVEALTSDPAAWPGVGLLVADHQVGGHGRSGRDWQTPARAALTVSLSMWAPPPLDSLGWLPLLGGLGAVYALRATAGAQAGLKWPNDLLIPDPGRTELEGWGTYRKVGGILSEVAWTSAGPAVILGIGVNVSQVPDELPVPSATSLALAGLSGLDREVLLVALVTAFTDLAERWIEAGGDAVAAGLADEVAAACVTIGKQVRVDLPGGTELVGLARRLMPDGALVVLDDAGEEHVVLAGDVLHVRSVGERRDPHVN